MAANRREFPRVSLFKFIVETKMADGSTFSGVEVVNISAGGLCFLTRSIVHVGDHMEFRFPLRSRTIILPARVIRVDGREAGVQYTCDRDAIIDFVDAYNEEIRAMTISKKEESHLVVPGYNRDIDRFTGIDDILDPGKDFGH